MPKSKKQKDGLELSCPIPNTHRRLHSAHRLWHQTLSQHDSPDGFRTNLNATIQELRNVSWVLQKEQTAIPNFDQWYPNWQKRLREDPLARWLVEARNKIVKQGDLETTSKAHITLISNYGEPVSDSFDAPPLAKTRQIAAALARTAPTTVTKNSVMMVERRWETRELAGNELLDVLAHIYGILDCMLEDAHRVAGVPYHFVTCTTTKRIGTQKTAGRPACMITTEQSRTVTVKLETGEFAKRISKKLTSPKRSDIAVIEQRYGPLPSTEQFKNKDPLELARELHNLGLHLLKKDGYHLPVTHLFKGNNLVEIKSMMAEDRSEKFLLWHSLAKEIEHSQVDGLVTTNETWLALFDPDNPERPAAEAPDRTEGLHTLAATADGRQLSITTRFSRKDGQIIIEGTDISSNSSLGVLEPIRRVWHRKKP